MPSRFERYLPYSGVLAGVLFALGGYLPKVSQKFGDPNAVAIMKDHAVRNGIGAVATALCAVALLFFAAALRQALRSGEGGESTYSGVAYAGAILVAASQLTTAWLTFAGADAADHDDKAAVDTLAYLGIDGWLPWAAASAALLIPTGFGGLRNAVLPRWLGIVTVILGIGCLLGPTGIAVWFATPVWLVVTGVVLGQRQSADRSTQTHAMATA